MILLWPLTVLLLMGARRLHPLSTAGAPGSSANFLIVARDIPDWRGTAQRRHASIQAIKSPECESCSGRLIQAGV